MNYLDSVNITLHYEINVDQSTTIYYKEKNSYRYQYFCHCKTLEIALDIISYYMSGKTPPDIDLNNIEIIVHKLRDII